MIEPRTQDTTMGLLTLPSDHLSTDEREARFEASMRLLENAAYEQAASEIERNPGFAFRICEVQSAPHYPALCRQLMARAFSTMTRLPEHKRAGGAEDQARQRAFRVNPGKYLPGASPDRVVGAPPGIHHIYLDGHTWPWTYVSPFYARSDVAELIAYRERCDFARAYAIGEPRLDRHGGFPVGVIFVPVALPGGDA